MTNEELAQIRADWERIRAMADPLPWRMWAAQLRSGGPELDQSRLIADFLPRASASGGGDNVANLYLAQLAVNSMGALLQEIETLMLEIRAFERRF